MATNEMIPYDYSKEEAAFVERFVYDVIVYTLKKCGYPEKKLPPTDLKENVYHRAKFVKIAGASTLRVALISREKWRQMFVSRRKNSNFGDEEIRDFLLKLVCCCCQVIDKRIKQSTVELFLASFNEISLFLHNANIDFNFNKIVKYISLRISLTIGEFKKGLNSVEGYFDKFENVSRYDKWITNFIKKYAIPYGSREDVSDLFLERVKSQFKLKMRSIKRSCMPSLQQLLDLIGFLPYQIFLAILSEETVVFKEALLLYARLILNQEAPEVPKSPNNPESDAVEKLKSDRTLSISSVSVFDRTAIGESNDYSSDLGIEEDFGQMNLPAEGVSQEIHSAIPKKNWLINGTKNQ